MTAPGTLRQLHASLAARAPEQIVTILQEVGYAAGEGSYRAFSAWLPGRAGVDSPGDLDADLLAEVLSEFFAGAGWGTLTMSAVGTGALALDSPDWAEAEPGTVDWYAARTSPTTFWIFDTFESEGAREAHLNGEIAAALMAKADELLATPPEILAADVLARK